MRSDVAKNGYFAVLINGMLPSRHSLSEIVNIYGRRDEQEKSFMSIKSVQDRCRALTTCCYWNTNSRKSAGLEGLVMPGVASM